VHDHGLDPCGLQERDILDERSGQTGRLHRRAAVLHDDDRSVVLAHERQRLEERPRLRDRVLADPRRMLRRGRLAHGLAHG
jgi:hypothetical protein